jgi:hypothetical protein
MASIITATTTSGLTQSADNSGVLQLASGSGNLVTVPSVTGTAMVSGNMPAFSAYKSTTQSLSSATFTKITFDTEEFDTNSNFASSRFTPTVAGYYQITGALNNSTGTQTVTSIYKNGSAFKQGVNGSLYSSNQSALIYLNGSTDYVELYGYFGTGTSTGSGAEQTYFQGVLVRAA